MAKRTPRLLFTEEERQAPELKQAVKKSDRKADKLEKAQSNLPKKRVKKKERVVDKKTGKSKQRYYLKKQIKRSPHRIEQVQ